MEAYTKPASDSGHTEQDPAALSFYSNLCYGVEIGFVYLQYSATALINIFNGFECSSPFQMWLKSIKELHNFMWNWRNELTRYTLGSQESKNNNKQ